MKISLWSQFSSNHSSGFTVVGQFPTPEAAQDAAVELRRLIRTIADYYATHPEAIEVWTSEGEAPPTPPELQMAAQYQLSVDEERGLDWIFPNTTGEDVVILMDNFVFVAHDGDTWDGAYPFDNIMRQLGGSIMVDGWQDAGPEHEAPTSSTWISQLTCTALDDVTAQAIVNEIEQFRRESGEAWRSGGKLPIPNAPWQPVGLEWFQFDASTGNGKVEAQGRSVNFTNWYFRKLAYGFPALLAYLRERSCTDFHYALEAEISDDDD